jgi:oxygen-independent coproporphyrinogen III oxidase
MSLSLRQDPIGLYIHVPFCERRCHFCAFFTRGYQEAQASVFVENLLAEIRRYQELSLVRGRSVETIYFGGGTPTTLSGAELARIVEACRTSFDVAPAAEIGIEANPASGNDETWSHLYEAGFTRVSFGTQSFDDDELKAIGSPHTAADIRGALQAARRAGFSNLSTDLIYGLPGQSLDRLKTNLEEAIGLRPKHISLYGFTLEEGTYFSVQARQGRLALLCDDIMAEMYEVSRDVLQTNGYEQYEVSNFARPGYACRHNLGYWCDREWLGLGPSAHSYLDGERFCNIESLDGYYGCLSHRNLPVAEREFGAAELRLREAIAFGLRSVAGVKLNVLTMRYGMELSDGIRRSIDQVLTGGWVTFDGENLRPTRAGLAVADELAIAFL